MGQNEATLPTHPARSETKKVTDKEPTSNRRDPIRNTHVDEVWENQTTPRGAPPRPAAPFDAGSSLECCLLRWIHCRVPLLRAGPERGRLLQLDPICFRLREVREQLLLGIHCRVRVLRRGLERGRVLQEEPICHRLREVQLLPRIRCQVPLLRRGFERGRVLQEEPICHRLREVQLLQG